MRETRSQGRHPVMLAPEACLEGVRSRMGSSGGASLLAYCSYPRFVSLLMRAENVFYWNVITASSLLRLVNHRPVFYFDLGHIRAGLEPVYRQAVRWFFRGWQPPRLDPGGSLGADRLAHGWRESAGPVETMCANFRTAPTPAQVVDGFLSEVSPTPGVLHAHS